MSQGCVVCTDGCNVGKAFSVVTKAPGAHISQLRKQAQSHTSNNAARTSPLRTSDVHPWGFPPTSAWAARPLLSNHWGKGQVLAWQGERERERTLPRINSRLISLATLVIKYLASVSIEYESRLFEIVPSLLDSLIVIL